LDKEKLQKLNQMLDQGIPHNKIAEHFGVSRMTIHNWKKKLNRATSSLVLLEGGKEVMEKQLDMWGIVRDLTVKAKDLVDKMDQNISWDQDTKPDNKDIQAFVKALAEARKQAAQIADIEERLYNTQRNKAIMDELFQVLAEVDPETYHKFKERCARRGLMPRR
jgi:transposase-like protein